jgi:hypothetical protein
MPVLIEDLDLSEIAATRAVNYLHWGNALDVLSKLPPAGNSPWLNSSSLKQLGSHCARSSEIGAILRSYLRLKRRIGLPEFEREIQNTLEWRKRFRALRCRGFSYALEMKMRGYNSQRARKHQLSPAVNLRIALMARPQLFYPPRVQRYLGRFQWLSNHYHDRNRVPAVAFSFGRASEEAWYIFVMQSDPGSRGPTPVREHFRGWRNVLFANIVAQALGRVQTLYLARAHDVERACYPGTKDPGRIPDRWRAIYDRTAEEWGMGLVKVSKPVDIQIYRDRNQIQANEFYELSLTECLGSAA